MVGTACPAYLDQDLGAAAVIRLDADLLRPGLREKDPDLRAKAGNPGLVSGHVSREAQLRNLGPLKGSQSGAYSVQGPQGDPACSPSRLRSPAFLKILCNPCFKSTPL